MRINAAEASTALGPLSSPGWNEILRLGLSPSLWDLDFARMLLGPSGWLSNVEMRPLTASRRRLSS